MKVFTVFFLITFLLFSVPQGFTDEVPLADNLLTLSLEEIQMVSRAFSFVCDQAGMDRLHITSEQIAPYLHLFVQKCERFVLEEGSFPHDLSVAIFDVQLASDIGVKISDSSNTNFYSQLAVHLLQDVWRNNIKLDVASFLHLETHDFDESFNPALAYSEEIYVSSAILSALVDGSHSSLSDRLEMPVNLLLSASEKRKIEVVAENLYYQEQIEMLTGEFLQYQLEKAQQGRALRKFVISLFVFPFMLSINVLSVVIAFFAVRRWRRNRSHLFPRH